MSVDIDIKSNEDFVLDLNILDENSDPVDDLLNAVALMQIRSTTLSEEVLVSSIASISPIDGAIQFTVSDTVMSSLLAEGDMRRSLVYGVKITYEDDIDEQIISGRIRLTRGVVR
jgi:hypothetical protein